jgi:uncharacterized membrane protein HdeD (DUF308 family)
MQNAGARFILELALDDGERPMLVTNPFHTTEELDNVTRGWWVLLVSGLVSVVAGGIVLFTDWQLDDLAVFIGALFVVRGVVDMFSVPVDGSSRGWAVVLGALEVGVGIMVWAWPSPTLLVIAFCLGWYVMFSGIVTIAGSITGRDVLPYWGFMLAIGIIEVLLSFWLLARPGITLVAAVLALGLWVLLYGVIQIVIAFDLRRVRERALRLDRRVPEVSTPR